MVNELFAEVAAVILTASVISLIAYKLKQPLVVAYIVSGIVIGQSVLGFVRSAEVFESFSSFGIALLLFIVGLNLNWRNIKDVGGTALAAGLTQITLCAGLSFGVARILDFDLITSVLLGLILSFSSTIIVVKMLADKEDLDRLYGRITVGILLVQDLTAMLALLLLSAYAGGETLAGVLGYSLLKAVGAVAVLALLARFVVPHLFRYAANSAELLFLTALAWCFAVASTLQFLGFSLEIGALLAGVTLSGTGFQHEIETKIRPLRDFFVVLFFVVLGTTLSLSVNAIREIIVPAVIFSAAILFIYPLIVVAILRVLKHHPRTGFMLGTTISQVSEFAFILAGASIGVGLLAPEILPLVTSVALITITVSSYITANNEKLYDFFHKLFPFLVLRDEDSADAFDQAPTVVLLGYDKMGETILPIVQQLTKEYLVIDINPSVIENLEHHGIKAIYGDAGNPELLRYAQLNKAKMVISAIPDMAVNEDIMDFMQHENSKATLVVTVKTSDEAARCYALGATFVIVPSVLGGEHFGQLLKKKKTAKLQWGMLGRKDREYFGVK